MYQLLGKINQKNSDNSTNRTTQLTITNTLTSCYACSVSVFVCVCTGLVDLWTRTSTGCACSWKTSGTQGNVTATGTTAQQQLHHQQQQQQQDLAGEEGNECSCCVRGGCQCGENAPNRCGQCGLENYCSNSKCVYIVSWGGGRGEARAAWTLIASIILMHCGGVRNKFKTVRLSTTRRK